MQAGAALGLRGGTLDAAVVGRASFRCRPSSRPRPTILKDGHPVTFALHGFIEFKTLAELFPYIESQTRRWKPSLDDAGQHRLASELLRRGVESRVVSMIDERPLETLRHSH